MIDRILLPAEFTSSLPILRQYFSDLARMTSDKEVKRSLNASVFEGGFMLYVGCTFPHLEQTTLKLLNRITNVLQDTCTSYVLQQARVDNTAHVPRCLRWLAFSVETQTLTATSTPSYRELHHTFDFAYGIDRTLPMEASLVLEVPKWPNADQLEYVFKTYGETAWHYFKSCHSYKNPIADIDDTIGFNFNFRLIKAEDSRAYRVKLLDAYYDRKLYDLDIGDRLQALEASPCTVDYDRSFLKFLDYTLNNLIRVSDSEFSLQLYTKSELAGEFNISESGPALLQMERIRRIQLQENSCLPQAIGLSKGVYDECSILRYIHDNPIRLAYLGQSDFARWLLEASLEDINTAVLILLKKDENGGAYTLPGSREIILSVHTIMSYLCDDKNNPSVHEKDLRSIIKEETIEALRAIRETLSSKYKKDAKLLQSCSELLSDASAINEVRAQLSSRFALQFPSKHQIAYAPAEATCVIVQSLHLLSRIYAGHLDGFDFYGSDSDSDSDTLSLHSDDLKNYNPDYFYESGVQLDLERIVKHNPLNAGLLMHCMLKSLVDVKHLNRSYSLPLGIATISFDLNNQYGGQNISPIHLFVRDYYDGEFAVDSMLNHHWKLVQNEERRILVRYYEALASHLIEEKQTFDFLGTSVKSKAISYMFTHLFSVFVRQTALFDSAAGGRFLPSGRNGSYLEQSLIFFAGSDDPMKHIELDLDEVFASYSDEFKALLPVGKNSSVPYLLTCLLFENFVRFLQHMPLQDLEDQSNKGKHIGQLLSDFRVKCQKHGLLMERFQWNWQLLIENNLLPNVCEGITDVAERFRILGLPNVQQLLYYAPALSFSRLSTAFDVMDKQERTALVLNMFDLIQNAQEEAKLSSIV